MGAKLGQMPDYNEILADKVEINYEPIPISPIFAYDNIVQCFFDFIKNNDIKRILPIGIKSEYVDSVLTFKKRYMRIRPLQDAVALPCVICKSSLADTTDRIFQNDVFNCDIANDTIASRIHPRTFADVVIDTDKLFFGITPRNAALNVEISVLDDSEQKMDNLLLMWDRIRFQNLPFDMVCTTKNILPSKQALLLAYHLGFYKDKDLSIEIPKTNYVEIYKFLNLHISPECPFYLTYEKDTSTSHMEILLCFDNIVEVQPEILNKSNDKNLQTAHDKTLITRPFTLYFNTISFMYLWIPKSQIDLYIEDLLNNVEKPDKIEVASNLISTNFKDVLDYNSEPIPQFVDNCSLYTDCDFDIENLEDIKDIDCNELLDIRAQAYIEAMQSLYPEYRWHEFYDIRIDSTDEFTVDYKKLHISITPKTLKIHDIIKIAIYINKSEMDYFLNSSS